MSGKRPIVLMGVLLACLAGYVAQPMWLPLLGGEERPAPPLPGESAISALEIRQDGDGRWFADVEYYFNGITPVAHLQVRLFGKKSDVPGAGADGHFAGMMRAERGRHRASLEIRRTVLSTEATTTERVQVVLHTNRPVAQLERAHRIDWPDWETWSLQQQVAGKPKEEVLRQAVRLINTDVRHSVGQARPLLERLLARDPNFAAGYVEMARVAMKTDWGPQGLHQAETFLSSALRIQADSADAKILLGYVYAHQGRHKDAERMFVDVSTTETPNQWLWVNWGEPLFMQGKASAAVEKYRVVVGRPRTDDAQDRPRLVAYEQLLRHLERRNDLDGMEALLHQRVTEFGEASCHAVPYARFLLTQRGDATRAMASARRAVDAQCGYSGPRDVLGMVYYTSWANSDGAERETLLNQARIYLPAGAWQMYLLSTSDPTARALRALLVGGERIDRHDNEKHSALVYALQHQDHAAVRRLVRLGARLDSLVGAEDLPVALLPAVARDFAAIRLMQQLGVNYANVRHRGLSALDYARQSGDGKLLQALDPRAGTL